MPSNLKGKTIILTGSNVVKSVSQMIEQYGGIVHHFPLIEIGEAYVDDETPLMELSSYHWLIFTSQNGVIHFARKCKRANIDIQSLKVKVAAVGHKTCKQLQELGMNVNFIPSTFSADVFVKEFTLQPNEKALFVRGALAKSTIPDAFPVDEWTVYETKPCFTYVEPIKHCLQSCEYPIIIFASPSAVRVFAEDVTLFPLLGNVKVASIGHITTAELLKYGITPHIQPEIYTMQAVIEQLILEETLK